MPPRRNRAPVEPMTTEEVVAFVNNIGIENLMRKYLDENSNYTVMHLFGCDDRVAQGLRLWADGERIPVTVSLSRKDLRALREDCYSLSEAAQESIRGALVAAGIPVDDPDDEDEDEGYID